MIEERIKKGIGKDAKFFLKNNFFYFGKITNYDEVYVEFLDYKTKSYMLRKLEEIDRVEVQA